MRYTLCLLPFLFFGMTALTQTSDAPTLAQHGTPQAHATHRAHHSFAPKYDTIYQLPYTAFDHDSYRITYAPSGYTIGIRKGQQWVLNPEGRVICRADAVLPRLMGNTLLIKRNQHWGLVTLGGKVLLPVQCTAIEWHGDVLALRYQDQWHLFDAQEGHRAKQGGFEAVQSLQVAPQRHLLLVQQNDRWGVLNEQLGQIIPCEYLSLTWLPGDVPIQHLSQVQFIAQRKNGRGILSTSGGWTPLP